MATDQSESKHQGLPVKILKGRVIKQFYKLSVAVFVNRMVKEGVEPANLVDPKLPGFKQGTFAEKLSVEQVRACE